MKVIVSICILLFSFIFEVQSQDNFGTSNGIIVITATIDDRPVKYVSNELNVALNNETTEIGFELEKKDIRAESEFLLQYFNTEVLRFNGRLGIDYIRIESHPVQKFTVDGTLKLSGSQLFQILGEGTLTHLYHKDGISCLLDLSFHLSRDDITRSLLSIPDVETVHMEIVHTIMDKKEY